MTVIPDLERELVRAAARGSATRPRSHLRRRLSVWGAGAAAVVALVVVLVNVGGSPLQASAAARVLERAAQSAAGGLSAPVLHPGQAWFTSEVQLIAAPWEPVSHAPTHSLTTPGIAPPPIQVLPTTQAIVSSQSRGESWTFLNGDLRSRGANLGRARFFGSSAERERWIASGATPRVAIATDAGVLESNGFAVGEKTLTYRQVRDFPTSPAAVLRFLEGTVPTLPQDRVLAQSDRFANAAALLEQVPLLPAARAAVFRALAELPGVRYLGPARDPLGRHGVAIALDQSVTGYTLTPNGNQPNPVTHVRSELVFNPDTAALLAQETLLLNPPRLPGVRPPFATSWTAYLASRVVPQSSAPTLKALGLSPTRHNSGLPPPKSPPVPGTFVTPGTTTPAPTETTR